MALSPGRLATEEDAPDPSSAGVTRAPSEEATLAMASLCQRRVNSGATNKCGHARFRTLLFGVFAALAMSLSKPGAYGL